MYRYLPAAALVAALFPVVARADEANFRYTGFENEQTHVFDPTRQLAGYFRGSDNDRDGVIRLGELEYFTLGNITYVGDYCVNYAWCELSEFSYVPGGALFFHTAYVYSDEIMWFSGETVAGDYDYDHPNTYLWTGQTRFEIDYVPSVAEPPAAALALGGLLALGALRGRARTYKGAL